MTRDIDWGIPVPLDGWRDRPDKKLYVWFDAVIGYLSASIEWARRYGDARRPDPEAWQRWWQRRPRRRPVLLHGQGQHHLPLADLAGRAARLQRRGRARRQPGRARRAEPADRGGVQRVPHDERLEVLHLAQDRHLRRRLPARVRPRCAAVLHRRRRTGEPGRRLHLGRVRAAHQLRARQRVGQPGQPVDLDGAQELRRRSRSRPRRPTRRRAAARRPSRPSTRSETCCPAAGSRRRPARRCGSSAWRTSTSPSPSRGSSAATRSGRPPCCTPRCRSSTTPRRC